MCSTLASAKSFEFSVTAAVDEVSEDGQLVEGQREGACWYAVRGRGRDAGWRGKRPVVAAIFRPYAGGDAAG